MTAVELESDDTSLTREPQQARSRRTLEQLRSAAWHLLESEGVEGLTVVGVAAAAGVSVGSFYARFEGKEELLDHLEAVALETSLRSWREAAGQVDTSDLLSHLVHLYRRGPARRLLLLSRADGRSAERLDRLQESVARALAATLEPPTLLRGAALAAAARELAGAVEGPARHWLFEDASAAVADRQILETLLELASPGEVSQTLESTPTPHPDPAPPPAPASPSAPAPPLDETPSPRREPTTPVELFDVWG